MSSNVIHTLCMNHPCVVHTSMHSAETIEPHPRSLGHWHDLMFHNIISYTDIPDIIIFWDKYFLTCKNNFKPTQEHSAK